MRDLLLKGHKLAVLVRPTKQETIRDRIETILQMWEEELGHRLPRPVLLAGDVSQPNLGLTPKQTRWAKDYLDQIRSFMVLRF